MAQDRIDTLYDALKADDVISNDRQTFRGKLLAPGVEGYQNRKKLFEALKADGVINSNTYEEFAGKLGLHAVSKPQQQKPQNTTQSARPGQSAQAQTNTKWQPTGQQKAQIAATTWLAQQGVQQSVADTNAKMQRKLEPLTQEGREKIRANEWYARASGTPTNVAGVNFASSESNASGGQNPKYSEDSPRVYGVTYEDGKPKTQWLLPDGTVTTSLVDASQAEYNAGRARLARRYYEEHASVDGQLNDAYAERDRLDSLIKKRMQEIDKERGTAGKIGDVLREAAASSSIAAGQYQTLKEQEARTAKYDVDTQYRQLMSAARKNRETIQLLEDQKNNAKNGFWHSLGTAISNGAMDNGTSSFNDGIAIADAERHNIKSINEKRAKGIPLTREEENAETLLRNHAINDLAQSMYGNDYGAWGRAGQMTANSLSFMMDMLASKGAGAIAKKAANATAKGLARGIAKASGKEAAKLWRNTLLRRTLKVTGVLTGAHLAGGAYVTNTGYAQRMVGDMSEKAAGHVQLDGNGNYTIADKKSLFGAFVEAEREGIRENGSEMFGEFIPGVGGIVTKGLRKLRLGKLADKITTIGTKEWYKTYSQLLKAGGYNGIPGEALEEYEGSLFDALSGHADDAWRDLTSAQNHVDIWLGCATMGALLGAVPMLGHGFHITQYYRYKRATTRADQVASYRMTAAKWEPLRDLIDRTDNGRMASVVTNDIIRNPNLHAEEKKAALDYVRALSKMRGYNLAETNNSGNVRTTRNDYDYAAGQNLTTDVDRRAARYRYQQNKAKAESLFQDADKYDTMEYFERHHPEATAEQKRAMKNFLRSKAIYRGMVDAMQSDIEDAHAFNQSFLNTVTNKADGNVTRVKVKGETGDFYVTSGKLVLTDNGSVDTAKSDENFTVTDVNGKPHMIHVSDIVGNVDSRSASEVLDEFNKRADAEHQARVDAMNGKLSFTQGEKFTIVNHEGEVQNVHIEQDAQTGALSAVIEEEGQAVPLTQGVMDSLQQMSDNYLQRQYEENEAAAEQEENADEGEDEGTQPSSDNTTPAPQSRTYDVGDEVSFTDEEGNESRGVIHEQNPDGTFTVEFEEPPSGRSTVDVYTPEELDALTQTQVAPASEATTGSNTESTTEANAPTAPQSQTETQPQGRALDRIPTDENGQHQFENAPLTDTAHALLEMNNGDVDEAIATAQLMERKSQEKAERAKQHKDEGETVDEIQKNKAAYKTAQARADYWTNVVQTLEMIKKADELAAEEEKATPSNESAPAQKAETSVEDGTESSSPTQKKPSERIADAEAQTETNPTEAQKQSGNYRKGHVRIGSYDISIEQPKGSVRRGTDANGRNWESEMNNTYGYIRGTEGVDGDHIDVFLSNDIDNWDGKQVFVVDQYNPDGTFDEHKVMLGYNSAEEAKRDYLANYEQGWENGRRIDVTPVAEDKFRQWIEGSHRKTKPFSEYAVARQSETNTDTQSQNQERETHAYPEQPLAERTRKACESVAKALGMDLEWVDHMEANGYFTETDDNGNPLARPLIRIARDAENPLSTVFGHESTHAVRSISEDAYKNLVGTARAVLGEKEWQRRFDATKDLYEWQNLTDDQIAEEVVADAVGEMITNSDMAEQIAYRLDHPTLSALRDLARKMWEAVKRFVGKGTKLNEKEQSVKNFMDSIERAFQDARVVYAGESAAPTLKGMSIRFAENFNNYLPQAMMPLSGGTLTGNASAPVRHSLRQSITGAGLTPHVGEDGKLTLTAGGQTFDANHHLTVDDLKRADSPLVKLVEACVNEGLLKDADMVFRKYTDFLNRVLDKGDKGFEELSDQWAWTGEALYKSVSNNSDAQYAKSVDITRVCKKNEAVINAICELQLKQRYGVTPGQVLDLYNASIEQGFQVPCPVCYVFSRYINNGQYASALIQGKELYGDKIKDVSKMTPAQRTNYVQGWLDELTAIKKWKVEHADEIAEAKRNLGTIMQAVDVLAEDITSGRLTGALRTNAEKRVRALSKLYQNSLDIVNYASLDGWITNFAIFKKASKKEEVEDKVDDENTELTDETELKEGLSEEQKKKKTKEIKFDINEWFPREDTYREDGEIYPDSVALDLRRAAEASVEYSGIERFRHSRGAAAGKAIQLAADNALGETAELLGVANPENRDQNYSMLQKAYVEADPKKREKLLNDFQKRIHKSIVYAAQQTLRGGIRQWSWSDNIERLSPDVFLNLLQIHMLGGALQAYSKQLEGVELVASMNGYVNGSLMGKGIGYKEVDADYEGWKYFNKRDGKYYVPEFDNVVGIEPFDHDGKHGLFYLNEKYDRAGNIIVGMDDIHVLTSMADPRIFFIIPWHKSGMSNHILMQMYSYLGVPLEGLENARDYTDVQEEKKYNASDDVHKDVNTFWESHNYNNEFRCGIGTIESGQIVIDKDGKKHLRISEGQKHYRELRNALLTHNSHDVNDEYWSQHQDWLREIEADEFLSQVRMKVKSVNDLGETMTTNDTKYVYPYEYWDMQSTYDKADVNGKRYLEYCRRMGFQPKFVGIAKGKFTDYGNFAEEPGYWKLLIDRRMYDTKGKFQDLTPVTVDKFTPDLCDPEKTKERFKVTTVADEAKTKDIVERAMDMERERGYAKTDRTRSRQFVPKPKYDSSSTPASRTTAREKVVERYKKAAVADGRVLADAKRIIEDNAKKNWEKAKAKKGTSAEEVARLKDEYTQAKKEREKAENAVSKRLSLRKGEDIKKQFELTDKEKDDATKRIDERIAELHRQREENSSHNTVHGNQAEPLSQGKYSPTNVGVLGENSLSAKIPKGFKTAEEIAEKLSDFILGMPNREDIDADNFTKKLVESFQNSTSQTSDYTHYISKNGDRLTIRFSDHNGNARNIIIMGKKSDIGYSFVVRTPNTTTEDVPFKANKWANVLEFVYKNPSMERLEQIAKGVFDLVDNGEYTDLAGADEIHPSPRIGDEETNAIGARLSLRENAAEDTKQEPFTFSSPEVEAKVMEVIKGGADYDDIHELGSQMNNWADILAADEALARNTGYWYPELYQGMNETHPELNFIFQMAKGADVEMFEALYKVIDEIGYSPDMVKIFKHRASCWIHPAWRSANRRVINLFGKTVDDFYKRYKETHNVTTEGTNLGIEKHEGEVDEVKKLFGKLNKDKELADLFDKVYAVASTLNIKVSWKKIAKSTAGSALADKVRYNLNTFNSDDTSDQFKATTLLHELIHSCTNYAIDLSKPSVSRLAGVTLPENIAEAVSTLAKIYDNIKGDTAFKGQYGLTNIYEMTAELSNPEFRALLKAKNLWEHLVDAVCKLFGIERKTDTKNDALSNLQSTLEYLLDNFDRDSFDAYTKAVSNQYNYAKFSLREGKNGERSLITSGSYFSGGGLLEEGLKGIINPKVAVEFNEKIAGVYADNHGNHIVTADVRNVDPRELVSHIDGEVQYFHASPVCKNFSTAKHDAGEVGLDMETAQSTADFISEIRPKVVTIENVKGYRNSESLDIILDTLRENGYDYDVDVYNTADYGGYTKRERLIVRAVRDGKLPPKPTKLAEEFRPKGWMEAVEDLMDTLPEKKSGVPAWMDTRLKGEGIDWRHIDKPLYVFGQGNNAHSVPHAFADELLPTLRTKGGDVIIMPDGRVLRATPRVLARVTGLSDDYRMPHTDDMAHTIVGNGIPTQLSGNVIAPLLQSVFNESGITSEGGKRSSLRSKEESDIIEKAKADGTYMKAPNGKQSKLDERQWVHVRTKAFKDFFGDWENDPENASKVVLDNSYTPHAEGRREGTERPPHLSARHEANGRGNNEQVGDGIYRSSSRVESAAEEQGVDNNRYSLRQHNRQPGQLDMRAANLYEQMLSGRWSQIDEAWHDDLVSVRRLQEALEQATGRKVRDYENVYLNAVHKSSKNKVMMDRLVFDLVDPMIDAVKAITSKHGFDQDEVEQYLNCKHGLERNQVLAQRKADEAMANDEKRFINLVTKYFAEQNFTPTNDKFKNAARAVAEQCAAQGMDAAQTHTQAVSEASAYVQGNAKAYLDKARERDYSGLTGIFNPEGKYSCSVADLEDAALNYVNYFENQVGKQAVDELWKRIHALNNYSLHQSYRSGLISKEQYDDTRKMYQWYVPLRGFDETTADDIYDYLSHGEPRTQQVMREAKGRTSRAANILATMVNMGGSAIMHGNNNQVKQKLLNLALNYDNPLFSVSKAYYVQNPSTGYWEIAQRMPNESWDDYKARMEQEAQNGTAVEMKDGLDIPLRAMQWQADEHAVHVKRNGQEYIVYINGNPRAAQAINGLLRGEPTKPGVVEQGLQKTMSWLSKSVTSLNPEFVISNFERDLSYAVTVSRGKYGAGYAGAFMANVGRISPISASVSKKTKWTGIYNLFTKWKDGTLNMNNETEKYFKEFMENGGETGFTSTLTVDDYQAQIERRLADTKSIRQHAADGFNAIEQYVDTANRGVENICRFAAYMTSRQRGESILTSVQDAKEVSTNFNLHGSGALGNSAIRKIALFVNPAMQSVWQYAELTAKHPARMLRMAGATAMLGAGLTVLMATVGPLFASGGGDGDDGDDGDEGFDYWHINPFTRRNYIIIPTPWNGKYVKYNLAPEIRAIYGLGVIAAEAAMGHCKHENVAGAMLNQLSQLIPVSFFEPQKLLDVNGDPAWKSILKAFTPAYANPLAEAYLWNEDFMGRPISRDDKSFTNGSKPQFKLASDDTFKPFVEVSRFFNRITGGTDYTKGFIDFNPSKVAHLGKSYLGGIYTFVEKVIKTGYWMADGMPEGELDSRDVPILNRFLTTTDSDYSRFLQTNTDFNYYKGEYESTKNAVNGYEKEMERGDTKNADEYNALLASDEYKRYLLIEDSGITTDLKKLGEELKEADGAEAQKAKTKEIYQTRQRLVKAINKADEEGLLDKYAEENLTKQIAKETDPDKRLLLQAKRNMRRAEIRVQLGLMPKANYDRLKDAYSGIGLAE